MASTFALAFHEHEHHSSIHELILHETCFWNIATYCYISCVLFIEMNSVQHSSATCATHFSETWLVSTMQQNHEACETWLWNKGNISLVFPYFNTCDAWFCVVILVWLIILLNNLATLTMSLGIMFMLTMLPNYDFK